MTGEGTNRAVFMLRASGRLEAFDGPWRCIGAVAHPTREAATEALAAWLDGIRRDPGSGLTDPDPLTVRGSVAELDLVDTMLDGDAEEVFVLFAVGASAVHSGRFESLCRRAFTERAEAEREAEAFAERCCDGDLGLDHAERGSIEVSVRSLALAPSPGPATGPRI